MPLYEYQCDTCGHRFEKIKKFSDPPEETCPKCGSALRKLISAPAFQLKGTGWYITDYARQGATTGDGDKAPQLEKQDGTSASGGPDSGKTTEQAEKAAGAASSAKAGKSDEGGKAGSGKKLEKKASGSPDATKSKTSTDTSAGSKDAKS